MQIHTDCPEARNGRAGAAILGDAVCILEVVVDHPERRFPGWDLSDWASGILEQGDVTSTSSEPRVGSHFREAYGRT